MDHERPAPGEELNPGPVTVPRCAATVIVLRDGEDGLEVLLVQRNPAARFMGGAWVFPGGAVDRAEGSGDEAVRAAAVREVSEEAGLALAGPQVLVPFSRWITPAEVKIRFDTWFFLARAPEDQEPRVDDEEIVAWRWYRPADALQAFERGELLLVFPTIKHLEQLTAFESADALLSAAAERDVAPVQPRVVTSGESPRVVLPGEPGYDEEPRL